MGNLKKVKECEDFFISSRKLAPNNYIGYNYFGIFQEAQGNDEKAEDLYRQSI